MLELVLHGKVVYKKQLSHWEYHQYSNKVPGDVIKGKYRNFLIKDIFITINGIRLEITACGI